VVDRIKDLIIVAGQNYAAHDIEAAIGDVAGIRAGRAVAVAVRGDEGTEEIWVMAEVDRRTKRAGGEIERDVELRIVEADRHGAAGGCSSSGAARSS
jgi:acyl-CoA synthetase (AMP-forming)/AMP-acid ligase II